MKGRTSNAELRTPNFEVGSTGPRRFNLEDRLLEFSVGIIHLCEELPRSLPGQHIAKQILRSGTSPYANHGEAESAESNADFIHKLQICLKELRETLRWLRLIFRAKLTNSAMLDSLIQENDELVRIFVKSVQTAQRKALR